MTTTLVAFAGRAGSGKDTAATYAERLMREAGAPTVHRLAFADEVKRMAARVYREVEPRRWWGSQEDKDAYVPQFKMTVRQMLQRVGRVHEAHSPGAWVRMLQHKIVPGVHTVISDVRFQNEVDAVRDAGGVVYRLVGRQHSRDGDPSETAADLLGRCTTITNAGSLEQLQEGIRICARLDGWAMDGRETVALDGEGPRSARKCITKDFTPRGL